MSCGGLVLACSLVLIACVVTRNRALGNGYQIEALSLAHVLPIIMGLLSAEKWNKAA